MNISDHLKRGAENGIDCASLAIRVGTNERNIRKAVNLERMRGKPILSGPSGYYLPSDGEQGLAELKQFYALLLAGLITRKKLCKEVYKLIAEMEHNNGNI